MSLLESRYSCEMNSLPVEQETGRYCMPSIPRFIFFCPAFAYTLRYCNIHKVEQTVILMAEINDSKFLGGMKENEG